MSATVLVEYIGSKPEKADNVAGTGVVWRGLGDIQSVPIAAWVLLAKHTGIWREHDPQKATHPIDVGGGIAVLNVTPPAAGLTLAAAIKPPSASAPGDASTDAPAGLLGTDNQPSTVLIGERDVQLGEIVAAAQDASGLDAAAWNELEAADRDDFIEQQIEAMRTADADAKVKAAADAEAAKKAGADPVPLNHAQLKAELKRLAVPFKGNPSRETLQALYDEATKAKV